MKHINLLVVVTLAVGVVLGLLGSQMLSAQDNLKSGTVLQRTELKAAPGWEAILVQRILPPGTESGKHKQQSDGSENDYRDVHLRNRSSSAWFHDSMSQLGM